MQSAPRRTMTIVDEAKYYLAFRKLGLTIHQVCAQLEINRSKFYRRLRLLKLPVNVQKQLHEGRISMTEALRINHETE
jgi:ParB-like chromosome segregation protein Spo0J